MPEEKRSRPTEPTGSEHPRCCCGGRHSGSLLEAYLLLLIAENPSHGYELSSQLHAGFFPGDCAPDEATVYRNLRRMEEQGLVSSSWDTEGEGLPRRFYQVTPKGLHTLTSWAESIRDRQQRLALFLERFAASRKKLQADPHTGGE